MIRRSPRRTSWTTLDNALIEDERLSWRALGTLTYLLSRPDNWEANVRHLSSLRGEGDYAMRKALRELESAGYLVKQREHDEEGRWVWVQWIYECPSCAEDEADDEVTMSRKSRYRESRVFAENHVAKNHVAKIAQEQVLEVTTTELTSEPDGSRARPDEKSRDSRPSERDEALARFEEFWSVYPARNGKKLGKAKAVAVWAKLSLDEHRAAWRGARHYAASGQLAKDAHRWLRDRCWEEWQTPAAGGGGNGTGGRRGQGTTDDYLAKARAIYERDGA